MLKTNNPFEVRQFVSGNTVQVWYGPPGEPESEFIMQISSAWIPQIIETLRKVEVKNEST